MTTDSTRSRILEVMARGACNTNTTPCEACVLTAERTLTGNEGQD